MEAAFGELETEEAKLLSLHQLELDKVEAQQMTLDNEKERMKGVQKFQSSRIKLNVGGTHVETSLETLTKGEGGSMLASMFSGRHEMTPDDDGSFFIDRDGKHFRHILNYLRNGLVQVELNTAEAGELAVEAEYYGLQDLASVLRADAIDINQYLGNEIVQMRAEEARLRLPLSVKKSGNSTDGPPIQPYDGLISVFEDDLAVEMNNDCKDPMGFFKLLARFGEQNSNTDPPDRRRREASQQPRTSDANLQSFVKTSGKRSGRKPSVSLPNWSQFSKRSLSLWRVAQCSVLSRLLGLVRDADICSGRQVTLTSLCAHRTRPRPVKLRRKFSRLSLRTIQLEGDISLVR